MALFTRRKSVDKFVRELLKKRKSHVDIIHELLDEKYSPEEIARATKILSVDESRAHERYAQRAALNVVAPLVQEAGITPQQRAAALTQLQVIYDTKHTLLSTIALAEQKRVLARDAVFYLPQDSEAKVRFSQIDADFKEHVEGLGIKKSIPAELEQVDKVRAYLKTVEASTNEKTLEGFDKWYASAIERHKSWDMDVGQISIMQKGFEHYADMFDVIAQQSKAPKPERTAAPGRRATVTRPTPVRERVAAQAKPRIVQGPAPSPVAASEDILGQVQLYEQWLTNREKVWAAIDAIDAVNKSIPNNAPVDLRDEADRKYAQVLANIATLLPGFDSPQYLVYRAKQNVTYARVWIEKVKTAIKEKKQIPSEDWQNLTGYFDRKRSEPLSKLNQEQVQAELGKLEKLRKEFEEIKKRAEEQGVATLEESDIELELDDKDLLEQFRRIVQVKQALVPRIAEVYSLAQETRMLVDARGSQEQKVEMSSLFVELVDNIEKLLSGFKKRQVDLRGQMQKLAEDAQRLAEFEENVRTKKVSKESRASLVAYLDYQRQYVPLSKIAPKNVTVWISYFQRVQTKLEALRLPLLATPAPELKQTIGDVIYQLTLLKGKLTAIVELPYPQTAKTISRGKVEVLARSAEECMVLWSRIITGLDKIMVLAKEAGHAELLRNLQVMLQKMLPQDHGKMEVLMTKILSSLGLAAEHALKAVKPLEMADEVNLGLEELHKVHKTFNDARPIAVLEGLRAVLAIHARTST